MYFNIDKYFTVVTVEDGKRVPCHCPSLGVAASFAQGRTLSGVEVVEIVNTKKFMLDALDTAEGMSQEEWNAALGQN